MDTKKTSGENAENSNDISATERRILDMGLQTGTSQDDENLQRSMLDNTDKDGEPLNEASSSVDFTGEDLDVPGAELDDDNESIGEEDEENNSYSQADTK